MAVHHRKKAGGIGRLLLGLYWPLLVFGGIGTIAILIKGGFSALRDGVLNLLQNPFDSPGILILAGVCLVLTPVIIVLTLQQKKASAPPAPSDPAELFPELDYRLTPHQQEKHFELLLDGRPLLSLPARPGTYQVSADGLTFTLSAEQEKPSEAESE